MADKLQALVAQLQSKTQAEQIAAAEALAHLGSDAQPAAVDLVVALRTADDSMREWCTAALEDLGPPLDSQISQLIELSGDKSTDAAYWAVTLLGRAGADAAAAVPKLVEIVESSREAAVRERAAWALGKLGPIAATAAPSLRKAAAGSEARLARLANQALGAIEL